MSVMPDAPAPPITYYLTNLFTGEVNAVVPMTDVTFSLVLNGAGSFSGTIHPEDPEMPNTDWVAATAPNQNAVWVDFDGTLVYGGIIQTRKYNMAKQTVTIGANEFYSYWAQRTQAADYTDTWNTTAASVLTMADQIISDAMASAYSIPMSLNVPVSGTSVPSQYWLTSSYPLSQEQTIDSIVTELSGMGYPVGFDFGNDVAYLNGLPWPTLTLSYPRRGRTVSQNNLVLDCSNCVDFEWDEDGTQQGNQMIELATGYGGVGTVQTWAPSMTEDGYPLLQKVEDHMQISSTVSPDVTDLTGTPAMMTALGLGDLSMYAYPAIAPEITIPLFGSSVAMGQFITGDDIELKLENTNIPPYILSNPRFPNGIDFYLRIIQADVTVADQGLSTLKLTLNLPPNSTPITPPQ